MFADFAVFAKIREIKFPRNFSKSAIREIKFPRKLTKFAIREITGLPGLKPRFYLLLYDFFGPYSMTFYDHFMTFYHFK